MITSDLRRRLGTCGETTERLIELRHRRHVDLVALARLVVSHREAVLLLDDGPVSPLVLEVQVTSVDVLPTLGL